MLEALEIATGAANANRPYELNLNEIIVDAAIQVRVGGLDNDTLEAYVAVLENGGELPPIIVFRDDAGEHYLADGFHRYAAHEQVGKAIIKAFVRDGNRDQALDFAEGANLEHGLKLSNEDKKNILFRRLARKGHPWLTLSNGQLAQALGVSKMSIGRWMQEFSAVTNVTPDRSHVVGTDGKTYGVDSIKAANEARQNNPIPNPSPQAGKGDIPLVFGGLIVGSPAWINWVHDQLESGNVPTVPEPYAISDIHPLYGNPKPYLWQVEADGRMTSVHRFTMLTADRFGIMHRTEIPDLPNQNPSDLPQGYKYDSLDTGNGEASAIATDELAARRREGLVRTAIQEITDGVDKLLQNHDIKIMDVAEIEKRTALIAVIIGAMVRETHFIQQLVGGLDHMACLQLQDKLTRVDQAYNELAIKLQDQMREL